MSTTQWDHDFEEMRKKHIHQQWPYNSLDKIPTIIVHKKCTLPNGKIEKRAFDLIRQRFDNSGEVEANDRDLEK